MSIHLTLYQKSTIRDSFENYFVIVCTHFTNIVKIIVQDENKHKNNVGQVSYNFILNRKSQCISLYKNKALLRKVKLFIKQHCSGTC